MTESDLIDRVRDVVTGLGFVEAQGFDFSRQVAGAIHRRFIVRYTAGIPIGQVGMYEEAHGEVAVQFTTEIAAGGVHEAQMVAADDARTVLHAVIVDAVRVSGDYTVDDFARAFEVEQPTGAAYLLSRLRFGVNFEVAFV